MAEHKDFLKRTILRLSQMYLEADDHDNIKSAIRSTADMDSKAMQLNELLVYHNLIVTERSKCGEVEKSIMKATRNIHADDAQELLIEYITKMSEDRRKKLYRFKGSRHMLTGNVEIEV